MNISNVTVYCRHLTPIEAYLDDHVDVAHKHEVAVVHDVVALLDALGPRRIALAEMDGIATAGITTQ
jgi:hypothetical protein